MFWVINCNTWVCKIYEYQKPNHFRLIKEINHPENKLKNRDLVSDRQGHYNTGTATRGAYSPDTDPKQIKIMEFLREVANVIDHGRTEQAYQNLIVIAAPQTLGLLTQQLNKHVLARVSNRIQKDILHLSDSELLHYIKENAAYPDS